MGNFVVDARTLTSEEQTILFGEKSGIKALKVLDVDNYFNLFKAIHKGDEIVLPSDLSLVDSDHFVYIYCDLPVGSRYFYEKGLYSRYQDKSYKRDLVYNLPIQYASFQITSFTYPFIKQWAEIVDKKADFNNAPCFSFTGNASSSGMRDIFLSTMMLTIYNKKVVSCVSYEALNSQFNNINLQLPLFKDNKELCVEGYFYSLSLIPKEKSDELGLTLSPEELETLTQEELKTKYNQLLSWKDKLKNLFSWLDSSYGEEQKNSSNIVISKDYFRFNGLVQDSDKMYLLLANQLPVMRAYSNSWQKSDFGISGAFQSYFTNIEERKKPDGTTEKVRPLSGFGNIASLGNEKLFRHKSLRAKNNFIFLNEEVSTTKQRVESGLPETVNLDSDFFEALSLSFSEAIEERDVKGVYEETAVKHQFAIRNEIKVKESEVLNSRYESLKTFDSKLLILVKTSKAREALRKTAISRKITTAMSSVVSFATAMFSIRDLNVGLDDKSLLFGVSSCNSLLPSSNGYSSDVMASASSFKNQFLEPAHEKTLELLVNKLYESCSLENESPFLTLLHPKKTPPYRDFKNIDYLEQKTLAFSYLWKDAKQQYLYPVFSPSSNQLNYIRMSKIMYGLTDLWPRTQENSYLINYEGNRLHYFFTNNFIETDDKLVKSLESFKNRDYCYPESYLVFASSGFNYSQEAVDSFSALKKCKTFTDYFNWYDKVLPILKKFIKDELEVKDACLYNVLTCMADTFMITLTILKNKEAAHLQIASPKKRGRKKKVVEETTEETAVETETTEELASLDGEQLNDITSDIS